MAKEGIDFFPLNCQMDEKIELVEAQYGLKGFAVVVKLLQRIYGEHGYYCEWNDDIAFLFARQNGLSNGEAPNNLICDIVSASIRRGIFDKGLFEKYHILTSKGIQKRYLDATSRRTEVTLKKEYLLLSADNFKGNVNILIENACKNQKNAYSFSQSKVKESKVNKNNTSCPELDKSTPSSMIAASFVLNDGTMFDITEDDVEKYKNLYPGIDVMQELRNIVGWCDSNPKNRKTRNGAKRFVNGWLSRAQNRAPANKKSVTGTKFNNFNQRDYDFAELERQLINK